MQSINTDLKADKEDLKKKYETELINYKSNYEKLKQSFEAQLSKKNQQHSSQL